MLAARGRTFPEAPATHVPRSTGGHTTKKGASPAAQQQEASQLGRAVDDEKKAERHQILQELEAIVRAGALITRKKWSRGRAASRGDVA